MLAGTPYLLNEVAAQAIAAHVARLDDRVSLLRSAGKLTPKTIATYYKKTRFQQIAESNALEGSPLSEGETEEAITKGVTLVGHDPGWSRDARSLAAALDRLVDLARKDDPVGILEVKEIHSLIFGERPGGGTFRSVPVQIKGSPLKPPATITEVLNQMTDWESWSQSHDGVSAVVRAAVLHAWLANIHPFVDGNGRTSRAITNLELIRRGFPPLIIRRVRDRDRYLQALRASDDGDIGQFLELIIERADDALRDLERTAHDVQGYDAAIARIRAQQANNLAVWQAGVELLAQMVVQQLATPLGAVGGSCSLQTFKDSLPLDDYLELCERRPISRSWLFKLSLNVPGLASAERLAWAGYRTDQMQAALPRGSPKSPSIFWSRRHPNSYPPWQQLQGADAPGGEELVLLGERWWTRRGASIQTFSTTELAGAVARDAFAHLS